jgi:short subunit dehydrogenase-like uncharacterized protein
MSRRRGAASSREFDVVLYGATGFVGRQTIRHFVDRAPPGLRWAVAGRSAQRLERAIAHCGADASRVGVVVADAHDEAALDALAARTSVVASTAGPFALHGSALVAACVARRTHYVDITGETPWVRDLIDAHHERAAADGTRIVPCCGFDSVPSDLGAWLVARAIRERDGVPCVALEACFSLRGGFNGGTLASALNLMDTGEAARVDDPFLLNPPGTAPRGVHADPVLPCRHPEFGWVGPFFMGPVNTRVVRRSAALSAGAGDAPYARDFRYREWLRAGRGPAAGVVAAGLAAGSIAGRASMRLAPLRALARRIVPAPGEGPSERSMDAGGFRCELVGTGANGTVLRGRIAGRGDPGNRATTVFVCEAALALAVDLDALPGGAGFGGLLTPATALGEPYARRLAAAGITVEPLPD